MVDPGLISLIELGVLAVGVTIAVLEIRNMSQTRRTEVTLRYFDLFTSPEIQEVWRHLAYEQNFESNEEWTEKYGPTVNPEAYKKWLTMMTLHNASGYLLKKGLVDLEDIHHYSAPLGIISHWEKFKSLIEYRRKQYNYPRLWESFEYLYNESKKKYPQLTTTSPYE
jgi:hypothetical protein